MADHSQPARAAPAKRSMFIDGQWQAAQAGATIEQINPATEQIIATVPAGGKEDVDRAVSAARKAFDSGIWSALPAGERGRVLWKLAELIEGDAAQLAELETANNGMPLAVSRGIIGHAAESMRYWAGWAGKTPGIADNFRRADDAMLAYTHREPFGVAALITPWNFPFSMASWKVGPALAAGCCAVLKPAELTSLTALRLGELAMEAGLPEGVLNIVTGFGHQAGAALAEHPGVDKISFTGSTAIGKQLIHSSAGNMKRLTLELGGKSPFIIFADADLEKVIPLAAQSVFFNSGQVCVAGTRIYAERAIYDQVVDGVRDIARSITVGDGMSEATQMGPLISKRQRGRVMEYIENAIAEGASIVAGGKMLARSGFFFEPTVLTDTRPDMRVVREEIFGPVASIMPFDNLDAVVAEANDTDYGLAASIWTGNMERAHGMARRLRVGTVWLNCHGVLHHSIPFGGMKESGWGVENGLDGIGQYLSNKTVMTPAEIRKD